MEETSSNSINEDDEDASEVGSEEWGLRKGMELFEVSAKDDLGGPPDVAWCERSGN
jgi:hypothetical protein